jgi:superfamily II DNA or RNA helicase/HKD family nuclease
VSIFRFRHPDAPNRRAGAELPDGLYEDVVSEALHASLSALGDKANISCAKLSDDDAIDHLAEAVHQATRIALDGIGGKDAAARRLALANQLLALAREACPDAIGAGEAALRPELLLHVIRPTSVVAAPVAPRRPSTPLTRSELFVNAEHVGVIQELLSEIESADRIDLICAFIKWSGLIKFRDALAQHCARGRQFRVLTTTYLGATDARAVEELARLGAEVKVAYEDVPTRLHAKAWLFHRETGLSTAYVGSSNLSRQALTDGIEWNVRIAWADVPQIIERFDAVFERYWEDASSGFAPFRGAELDGASLRQALARARMVRSGREVDGTPSLALRVLDVEPKDFQRVILQDLALARARGSRRNLVVAATGTGKTVISALDYRRLRREGLDGTKLDTLLFVAHRDRILQQSCETFRAVLKEPTFGELLVGGERPSVGRHVFGSIQSLESRVDEIPPDQFDVVVIDEVHHGASPTYRRLLERLHPKVLVGLTATPERMDDAPGDVLQLDDFFDRPWAAELRVWDAIDRQILVPFNYFAVDDGTDLRSAWRRGRYEAAALENVYDANRIWVRNAARAIAQYVRDPGAMRAIAFCVGIGHAELAARELSRELGVPAVALTSRNDSDQRAAVLNAFESDLPDRPRVICTVDLFNEGVDLPRTDTLLLLRPTESATLFVQQIGRGLRRADGKDALTILDFVGLQHENFRFEAKYKALLGLGRRPLREGLQHGFARLPAGCTLQLDEKPREQVLAALKRSLRLDDADLAKRVLESGLTSLTGFLDQEELEPLEFFRDGRTWSAILERAGVAVPPTSGDAERDALGQVQRLIHLNDPWRLGLLDRLAAGGMTFQGERDQRLGRMILGMLYGLEQGTDETRAAGVLGGHQRLRFELGELAKLLRARMDVLPAEPLPRLSQEIPLHLHARYRTEEIAAAFNLRSQNKGTLYSPQVGTFDPKVPNVHLDVHLITLDKSGKQKLPHLQYRDYALSPTLFHWESQASTTRESASGRRHLGDTTVAVLFVRELAKDDRGLGGTYRLLGTAKRVADHGERPISITYRLLDGEIPPDLLSVARSAVA